MAKLRALQTFAGLEGRIRRGAVVETNEDRAKYLISAGLAERLDRHAGEHAPSRSFEAPPGPQPEEINDEITAVGGGWYEWRGRRYRGKAAAEEAREQEG